MKTPNIICASVLIAAVACHEAPKTVHEKCLDNVRYGLSGILGSKIIPGAHAPGNRTCEDIRSEPIRAKCSELMHAAAEKLQEACELAANQIPEK